MTLNIKDLSPAQLKRLLVKAGFPGVEKIESAYLLNDEDGPNAATYRCRVRGFLAVHDAKVHVQQTKSGIRAHFVG